jgi:hypothetical protein
MPIRFSEDGLSFPDSLIDEMLEGRVLFLCGAGVSSPQLPGFKELAQKVYKKLGVEMSRAEEEAFKHDRYEEALGSLARRLSNPDAVSDAVAALLVVKEPDLEHHEMLLRLSRDIVGRPAIVTTNFDTLFERAYERANGSGAAERLSLAGQALPAPGGTDFCGIIHLHGRLKDEALGLDASPLVLTSAQYGEAYMRSGWASRFLFDLARCCTLVLVGYQAGDAPVRYFLNVLEADRSRFPDLRKVYAIDGHDVGSVEEEGRWGTVAVEPLLYKRPLRGDRYRALWRDLNALVGLADRPRAWRTDRAQTILSKAFDESSQADRDLLDWLFRGKQDLWPVAIQSVSDPRWFEHFTAQKIWGEDAGWVLSAWCARDWLDRNRLESAIAWAEQFGAEFSSRLANRLRVSRPVDALFLKAWRTIARNARRDRDSLVLRTHDLEEALRDPDRTDTDLRAAVRHLRPSIVVGQHYERGSDERPPPRRLSDLMSLRLDLTDRSGLAGLMDRLLEHCPVRRLLEVGTEELRIAIEHAKDAELIAVPFDRLDDAVPTVERHTQNKFHSGVVFLVQLLTEALKRCVPSEAEAARDLAKVWLSLESRIGRRLWLQSLRQVDLFTSDEVANAILELSKDDFWSIKRELILAMTERLSDASPGLTARIEERILAEASGLYDELGASDSQNDWRPLVRDRDAWLRLTALRKASRLGDRGALELEAIKERRPFMSGSYDESDLFSSYSTGVRYVSGNAEPLSRERDPKKRLEVAKTRVADWDSDTQHNWSAYCSVDPAGALASLQEAELSVENAGLWSDLIGSLSWRGQDEAAKPDRGRSRVILNLFRHLEAATGPFLSSVGDRMVDLLPSARKAGLVNADGWWDRLWTAVEGKNEDDADPIEIERFYDRLINRPAGRLAEQLITEINARKTKSRRISVDNRSRLHRLMRSETRAGWYARGACAREAGFLTYVDFAGIRTILRPRLSREDVEGKALRSVLVEWARPGDRATALLRSEILQGVRESQAASPLASHVAAKLLQPLYNRAVGRTPAKTRTFRDHEVRDILKVASPSIVEGFAECLASWVQDGGRKPENAWHQAIRPIFEQVWPRERSYRRSAYSVGLAKMAVHAGGRFPEALEVVRHYLTAFQGDYPSLHFLSSSKAPDMHPVASLDLLWILCGPDFSGRPYGLNEVIKRIAAADRRLELDRRLQWLEQRAPEV